MSNPLIRRYQYSLLRPNQIWIYGLMYSLSIGLLLIINLMLYAKQSLLTRPEPWKLFRNLFIQFAVFEHLLLWGLIPYNISRVIPCLMLEKSYDFLRLLPLSAFQKMTGIILGRNLILLMAAAVNFLFYMAFGLAGRIRPFFLFQLTVFLLSVSLLLCLLALLISLHPIQKHGNLYLILIPLFFMGVPILTSLFVKAYGGTTDKEFFYIWPVPILLLASGVVVYLACWAWVGNLRRFTYEYEPLFSWTGAFVFQILSMVVLLGFFYHPFVTSSSNSDWGSHLFFIFSTLSLIPTALLVIGARRTYEKYLELSRRAAAADLSVFRFLRYSNLTLAFLIFLLWAGFSLAVCRLVGFGTTSFLIFAGEMFTFYTVLMLLFEISQVLYPRYPKLGIVTGSLGILYLFLPYILSFLFEEPFLMAFSPLGYLQYVSDNGLNWITIAPVLLNILLCLVPALLVFQSYQRITFLRKRIEGGFSSAAVLL